MVSVIERVMCRLSLAATITRISAEWSFRSRRKALTAKRRFQARVCDIAIMLESDGGVATAVRFIWKMVRNIARNILPAAENAALLLRQ